MSKQAVFECVLDSVLADGEGLSLFASAPVSVVGSAALLLRWRVPDMRPFRLTLRQKEGAGLVLQPVVLAGFHINGSGPHIRMEFYAGQRLGDFAAVQDLCGQPVLLEAGDYGEEA